jgi:hypothetical protein
MLRDVLKLSAKDWAVAILLVLFAVMYTWFAAGALTCISPPVHFTMPETAGVQQAR